MTTNNTNTSTTTQVEASRPIRIGISQGDTNGVGYELIFKTFSESTMFELCTPIVFGHIKVANYHRKALNFNTQLNVISSAEEAVPGKLNFVNCSDNELKIEFGVQSPDAGHAAFQSLEQAVIAYKSGEIDALVTAPINKKSIQSSNFHS